MSTTSPYDLVVSLGKNCQPAYHIRRYTGVKRAQIFDWVGTPDAGLRHVLRNGFDRWFHPDDLHADENGNYFHRTTGVSFLHQFNSAPDFATGHAKSAPRIDQLVVRWLDLVTSTKSVLFIRMHGEEPDIAATAAALAAALVETTSLSFDLLYLVKAELFDPNWQVDGVTFRPHSFKGHEDDWRGYESEWDDHFAAMNAPRCAEPAPWQKTLTRLSQPVLRVWRNWQTHQI